MTENTTSLHHRSGYGAQSAQPFAVGMKSYDNDWYLRFNLSYDAAAALLSDWGVTFVIAQSRALPMPDSAVKSEVPPELKERFASYDDRKFRDALARRGILYIATCAMFFDPTALADDPALAAIDAEGRRLEKIDWYAGIPPTRRALVDTKVAAIDAAVRLLEPDGVHLGFMRWPGFWELWTPQLRRADFPEYSYDAESLAQFETEADVALPTREPSQAARWISANAAAKWVDWKCQVVVDVIRRVRDTARRIVPDAKVALNTLPLGRADFDNAVETTFGQRFESLADVIDVFEVMAYHQILKRPPEWIARVGEEIKARSGRTTVCTLQAVPLYLEGVHAAERRVPTLTSDDLRHAADLVMSSSVDGVVFFIWRDFLEQAIAQRDFSRVNIIRELASRRPA
jgi:hypothetical protein